MVNHLRIANGGIVFVTAYQIIGFVVVLDIQLVEAGQARLTHRHLTDEAAGRQGLAQGHAIAIGPRQGVLLAELPGEGAVAFVLKRENEPTWVFGLVLAASAIGGGLGNVVAPLVRRVLKEEWILAWALMLPGLIAVVMALCLFEEFHPLLPDLVRDFRYRWITANVLMLIHLCAFFSTYEWIQFCCSLTLAVTTNKQART